MLEGHASGSPPARPRFAYCSAFTPHPRMSSYALGVMVSASTLHAVLLEHTDEGTVVQFQRSRSRGGTESTDLPFDEPGESTPGVEDEPDDVTIEFGDSGGNGDDMFLGSEFDEIDDGAEFSDGGGRETWNFRAALDDLLEECEERGYEDPEVAFCTSAADVDEVELRLPADESGDAGEDGPTGLPLPASRSTLLQMLEEQYDGAAEDERVGFVPMHRTGDGRQRVLALIARPGGSVISTLSQMQEQTLARSPRAQLLDTEVPLYLGLARSALQLSPDTAEKTILVRAGEDNTLVLFMEGNTLRQAEQLPELTVDDPAETICSRVLLLQDEYGMGDVQHLLLAAEEEEGMLADAFKSYFASSKVRLLRTHLPNGETESSRYLAATGAALRLLDDPEFGPSFQEVSLLPKECRPSPFRIPVGWSVPVLLVLLGVTTLGFVWYYVANANAIGDRRTELQALEREVAQVDQQALERRIDSLESVTARYAQGLDVLDRLLRGSNKWSRGLATVTGQINSVEGVSIAEWSPSENTSVTVSGRASSRPRVVRLAQELGADINSLTFTEVREASLYDFNVTVPLDTTKPEAVEYWREQQLTAATAGEDDGPAARSNRTAADSSGAGGAAGGDAAGASSSDASGATTVSADSQSTTPFWTVVAASLARRDSAMSAYGRVQSELASRPHEVTLCHGPENQWYRVSVGAFPSFDAALSALKDMQEVLPEGAWIHECTTSPIRPAAASTDRSPGATSG